jgi:hypothetical protein
MEGSRNTDRASDKGQLLILQHPSTLNSIANHTMQKLPLVIVYVRVAVLASSDLTFDHVLITQRRCKARA